MKSVLDLFSFIQSTFKRNFIIPVSFRFAWLLVPSLFASIHGFAQTTYYVAANGSDSNDGRSAGSAFQTMGKVNSLNLQAGNQVLFRRGDTFRGTLTVRQSGNSGQPIIFDAYGNGTKPVLAASVPVTGWSNIGNGVWQAGCSSCGNRVTGLYRNGNDLPLGRYPNSSDSNKGYLTIQSHSGDGQITSQQGLGINLNTGWNGAEVVIRATQWVTNRYNFNGQNGNTLNLTGSNNGYGTQDNWGFFVQNHPATLDQTGEWAFDTSNKTFRLYDPSGNPNNQTITATVQERSADLNNVSNVTIRNLELSESLTTGLYAYNGNNLTFSSVDVKNSGVDGVSIFGGGSNILIENSTVLYSHNNGVQVDPYTNFTFRGNILRHAGVDVGRGNGGDGQGNGMRITGGQNIMIENNVLDSIGYNGITYNTSTTIQRNVISNFCFSKSDGGGIYTWNGNRNNVGDIHVLNNVVFNGLGALEGTPGGAYSGANGIFFDDCSQNAEVSGNSVFNCYGLGINLRAALNININNNTLFNNGEGQLQLAYNQSGCLPRNNTVNGNILVSRLPNQFVAKYETNQNDLTQYGNFDNNYYLRPFEDVFKIRVAYNPGSGQTGADLSLSQWQSQFGKDANSKNSPLTYSSAVLTPTGNVLLNNTFDNDANGWGVAYSNRGNGRVDYDNSNRLDGGSLRMSFPTASSQSDSYVLASNNIGGVTQGKTYQFTFDAVATGNKRVEVILRQKFGNYSDVAPRSTILLTSTRQKFTIAFSANMSESVPIVAIQVLEDGQTAWFDNMRLEEAMASTVNPDDKIKYYYNPTAQNSTVSLSGNYLDAKGQAYSGSITLAPYSSIVLLKNDNNTQTTTLRTPENPANAVAGLDYSYYEGSFSSLPDFSTLTPVKTGINSTPAISVRSRDVNYALRYTGYVSVPTDGQYTFYTTSDDGSKLYIGSTEVVNNDGGHGDQERSGTIGLKAGVHALTITYFQGGGGQSLSVSYSGPNVNKQLIPDGALYRVNNGQTTPPPTTNLRTPENPANTVAGLDYSYYEGSFSNLPDFNTLTPVKTGVNSTPAVSVSNRDNNYALRYTGYVSVPTDGQYTFYTTSDDGTKLFIGSTEVVNNDGVHADQERSGTIGLKAGVHALTVTYFQGSGGQSLLVSYSGPSMGKQSIPASALYRVNNGQTTPPPTTNLRTPENPANAVAGLDYSYYEGSFSNLPDFNTLTPVKTGVNSTPAITVRNRDVNYALRYTGYVSVPTDGQYTFYTTSDDGSKLYIGSTEVVNNDGGHDNQERSGTIGLKAGVHALTVTYFQGSGGQSLLVSYSGPSISKQTIPDGALYRVNNGQTTPPPTTNLRTPENPANAVAGLDYSYYELSSAPSQLPDFSSLTPTKTGMASTVDLSPRSRDVNYALRYTGYVSVPTDGQYTFYTFSDDGSKLYIGSTEVVNNDALHGDQERSGTIGLKAGVHALTVAYFQNGGGQSLSASYAGPNVSKQTIPTSAFFRTNTTNTGTGTGLRGEYFNNKTLTVPSALTRTDATVDFDWGQGSPASGTIGVDNFSVRWMGQVEAPVSGNYTFSTISDDGVRLWFNGNQVINNFSDHATTTDNSTTVSLIAGQRYDVRMEYYESTGGAVARLLWNYPGQNQQVIPRGRLYPATGNSRIAAADNATELSLETSMQVYPNPASAELHIRYNALTAGQVQLQLISPAGVPVLETMPAVEAGLNELKLQVRKLNPGFYILTLTQGSRRLTHKVILIE